MRYPTLRTVPTAILAIVAALLVGCAAPPQARTTMPDRRLPITDVKTVAGKWGGLVTGLPGPPGGDWVDLVIRDDGTYAFQSYRTIGVALGDGMLTLKDGTLVTEGPRGRGTFTLHDRGGKPLLLLQGVLKSAELPFTAELTRAK